MALDETDIEQLQLLSLQETETLLSLSQGLLNRPHFRIKIGLQAYKIGRRLFFKKAAVVALVERSLVLEKV